MDKKGQAEGVSNEEFFETSDQQIVVLLEGLLNKQIESVRNYDIRVAAGLSDEIGAVTEYVGKEKILDKPGLSDKKRKIKKLYKDLGISITMQRDEISAKLKEVRKAKKTLQIYSRSV